MQATVELKHSESNVKAARVYEKSQAYRELERTLNGAQPGRDACAFRQLDRQALEAEVQQLKKSVKVNAHVSLVSISLACPGVVTIVEEERHSSRRTAYWQ